MSLNLPNPTTSDQVPADPKNPAQKYYSGVASMVLAVAAFFIMPMILAPAALITGIVAVVNGGKLDNRKLRGEGWFGVVIASFVLVVMTMLVPA